MRFLAANGYPVEQLVIRFFVWLTFGSGKPSGKADWITE
jgi:hypothetical protein